MAEINGIPFQDVPEIRVWASNDALIIRSAALGKERRISLADLGIHFPNRDNGTEEFIFEIGFQSQNQDPDGNTIFILRGGQGGGTDVAIRNHWNAVTGEKRLQQCNDYTGEASDVWVAFGSEDNSPTGVRWVLTPVVEVGGDTVYVTNGEVNVEGTNKAFGSDEITVTLPPLGYLEPNSAVLNYQANPPVFEIISGETVAENASYAFPPTPADRLWISNFMLTPAGAQPAGGGPVKAAKINGGTPIYPDAAGVLPLIFSEKFKGNYVDGAKEANTYWIYGNKIWRTKQAFTSAAAPTVANAYWEVSLDASAPGSSSSSDWVQRTGLTVTFDANAYYGTKASPELGSVITISATGNMMGKEAIIYSNAAAMPTFSGATITPSNGNYLNSNINRIYLRWTSATDIYCSIT